MKVSEVDDEVELSIHQSWNEHPELFAELDQSKNSDLTFRGKPIEASELRCGTHKKLDWKCSTCEHEWKAPGSRRVRGDGGCPACSGRVVHSDGRNSMANTHPELAEEYQGDPNSVIAGGKILKNWKCSTCGHEWKAQGANRVAGNNCPVCAESGYNPSDIGYLYILHYSDGNLDWIKCGITNSLDRRLINLRGSANKFNIEIIPFDIYKFDDGWIARDCESELMNMREIRHNSNYDIEGKTEFFKYDALDMIKKTIEKWC